MEFRATFARYAVFLVLWAVIYGGSLARPALFDDADTVHAEAVKEMVQSGDWVTLKINHGIRYLEKAPLMYWLSALSVSLFGLSAWAIRLPVALFALGLTILIYRFGIRFWGERAGFYAGLVYLTSLGPYAFTRIFLPDVILTFFLALSFYLYLQIFEAPEAGPRLGSTDLRAMGLYVSAALAVLTKGLVGVVFLGMVVFVHLLLTGRWEMLRRLQIVRGGIVFLIVAAPWHLVAGLTNPGFFWFYFVNEHFLRYLGLRYPKDYDTVPRALFWILHLAWLFPWSAFLWGLARRFPRRFRPEGTEEQVQLFLYVWIVSILIFFSFSTTQEYYTFPTLPAFALLLGQILARLDSPEGLGEQWKARIGLGILAGVGVVAGGALFALASIGSNAMAGGDLSRTLTFNPEDYALSFGHMHDLTPATFGLLAPLVYRTAFFIAAGPLVALALAWRRRWLGASLTLAAMMCGLLLSYNAGMVAFEPVLSSKGLAETIEANFQPGDRIVVHGVYEKGSSINYYTGQQVSILNGRFGNLWYGSFFPDAPAIFYDDDSFLPLWNSPQRLFLFSERAPLETFLARHPNLRYRELARAGGKAVLVNW